MDPQNVVEYVEYNCISCDMPVAKLRKGSLMKSRSGIMCQSCIGKTSFMFVKNKNNYSSSNKTNTDDIFRSLGGIFGDIFKSKNER